MGRNYQGHGTKSKHTTVNRSQDQYKNQLPVTMPDVRHLLLVVDIKLLINL